jgi:hypothetical protein
MARQTRHRRVDHGNKIIDQVVAKAPLIPDSNRVSANPSLRFRETGFFTLPNGQGSARCSAFRRTDSAFEPSLYQRRSPPSGNAIFQGRDKDPETAPAIQWADCRDKMRARTAASSGLLALNREISVCVRLRGGGRSRSRTCLCIQFPCQLGN